MNVVTLVPGMLIICILSNYTESMNKEKQNTTKDTLYIKGQGNLNISSKTTTIHLKIDLEPPSGSLDGYLPKRRF